MSSHGASMLDESGVFGVFAGFALNPIRTPTNGDHLRHPPPEEVTSLLEDIGDELLVATYVTAGLRTDVGYLLRIHAHELTTVQAFVRAFRDTVLGEHSRQTEAMVGLVREPMYTPHAPDLDAELEKRTYEGPEPPRYGIVVPARKTAEWWSLSEEERFDLMRDHIEPTLEYLDCVRRQLYHASGLGDVDFITYFETDDLAAFHELLRDLQAIPEYHYVRYGDPTLVGRLYDPATLVDRLTRTSLEDL